MNEPKHPKGQNTQEAILKESARQFSHEGFHATGIDDIARSLGIAKGTLYQYFSGKEDLAVKSIIWSESLLLKSLDSLEIGEREDAETVMIKIAKVFFHHLSVYGDFIKIYFSVSPEVTESYRVHGHPFTRIVGTIEPLLRKHCSGFSKSLTEHELGILAFMNLESFRMETEGKPITGKHIDTAIKRRMHFFTHGILQNTKGD